MFYSAAHTLPHTRDSNEGYPKVRNHGEGPYYRFHI